MTRSSRFRLALVFGFLVPLSSGCMSEGGDLTEQHAAALTNQLGYMSPFAPTYYDPQSTAGTTVYWPEAEQSVTTGTIIANGPDNMPPDARAQSDYFNALQTYIDYFASANNGTTTTVLGYVDNYWGNNNYTVEWSIDQWSVMRTDGVMFDVSQRCNDPPQAGCDPSVSGTAGDADLARDEYFLQYALQQQLFGYWKGYSKAYVVFNWGTPYPYMANRYVDCLSALVSQAAQVGNHASGGSVQFIVREADEYSYMHEDSLWDINNGANSGWNWVWDYSPSTFIHLVHTYNGADTFAQMAAKAAARHAASIFVTDQGPVGTWNAAPPADLFQEEGRSFLEQFTINDAPYTPRTDCPAPDPCPPGYPLYPNCY